MTVLTATATSENEAINALTSNQATLTKQLKQVMEQQAKILMAIANGKMGVGSMMTSDTAPNPGMALSAQSTKSTPSGDDKKRKPLDPRGTVGAVATRFYRSTTARHASKKRRGTKKNHQGITSWGEGVQQELES